MTLSPTSGRRLLLLGPSAVLPEPIRSLAESIRQTVAALHASLRRSESGFAATAAWRTHQRSFKKPQLSSRRSQPRGRKRSLRSCNWISLEMPPWHRRKHCVSGHSVQPEQQSAAKFSWASSLIGELRKYRLQQAAQQCAAFLVYRLTPAEW